jgi:hypothetical protein
MAARIVSRSRDIDRSIAVFPTWRLEDAKARFSEVVR